MGAVTINEFEQSKHAPNSYPPPPIYAYSYPNLPPAPPNQPPYPPTTTAYPFAAPPPPAPYFSNPNHNHLYPPPPPLYQEPTTQLTFAKFILTTMLFLLIGAFAMSSLTWLLFGTLTPDFSVESLTIPSFNVSDTSLTAVWDVNVTVKNSNENLNVYFDRLQVAVVYEDTILGLTEAKAFHLSPKGEMAFEAVVSARQLPRAAGVDESYRGMAEDRRGGKVSFTLQIAADATLRSGSTSWRRELSLRVFCEDLEVVFEGPMGPGKLEEKEYGRRKGCVVYA